MMMMMRLISTTFPSVKLLRNHKPFPELNKPPNQTQPISSSSSSSSSSSNPKQWCVYLILSTNEPIKTYVGITTDFPRRLKQHNGEIKGGAKASSAGRPWLCACIITGFTSPSHASSFESKWKFMSRKLPRRKKDKQVMNHNQNQSDDLLQHRRRALDKVVDSIDCTHLVTDWKIPTRT